MDEARNLWEVKNCDDLEAKDLQAVADFFNENYPGVFFPTSSPDLWQWKLGPSNPAGRGFLTVAFADGRVVGTTSGTRQRIRLNGETVNAMEIGDTFTHPDFRRSGHAQKNYPGTSDENEYLNKSIFGRLVTETLGRAKQEGVEYVFGTPNSNSRPPYLTKLGFSEIGFGRVRAWNWISPRYGFASRYKLLLVPLLWLAQRITSTTSILHRHKFAMFEGQFDALASDLSHMSATLNGVEPFSFVADVDFYEHRYHRHPSHKYRYFQIARKGRKIGWIICTLVKRPSGRQTLVISDWISFDSSFVVDIPIFVYILSRKFLEIEAISIWIANAQVKRFRWLKVGFLSLKDVSIIEKSLSETKRRTAEQIDDFRFGWSDNG